MVSIELILEKLRPKTDKCSAAARIRWRWLNAEKRAQRD